LPRLDTLMRQVGELLVARNRLTALAAELGDAELAETGARIARLAGEMQDEVIAARMAPLGEVLERFPRLVRDLGRDLGKQIRCELEGDEIGLDRSVLDEIGEPLIHLVRNAADHGIETTAAREAAGKPPEGRIAISVTGDRDVVTIRLSDDGRGIDRRAIAAKARREGVEGVDSDTLDDATLMRVLARPGFSTAAQVSDVSGRGVGVDAAMTRIRALGGTLEVRSEQGRGTTFVVQVPLTLAIVRALLAQVGDERYAVPVTYVAETVPFDERAFTTVDGRDALLVRGEPVPAVHLGAVVGVATEPRPRRPAVVLEVGERRTALVVDALVGQQEIVVKPFEAPRGMSRVVGGATILADGTPALILDAAAIL
jgi:two-component system chemotaxis sensor kinase CheA